MQHWNEMVKMALLGTEKAPKPDAVLPAVLRTTMETANGEDREAYFYKAAALTFLYEKAGGAPEKMNLLAPSLAPETLDPVCPPVYLPVLGKLMAEGNRRTDLLGLIFDKIARQGFVLPHDFLVPVLNLGCQPVYKMLQEKIRHVAGTRGTWLAQFNPAWQYLLAKNANTFWQEGTPAERRHYVASLQQSNPQKAFELIRQSWDSESGRERKEWLKILQSNPEREALLFVEEVFGMLAETKGNVKQINLEIKKLALEILLSNPDSDLFGQAVKALSQYVATQKKMLGLQNKKILKISEKEDQFLCETVMVERFGFEQSSTLPGISTPAFWFCEILRCLHPSAWERIIGEHWEDILSVFVEAEGSDKKGKLPLLQHLSHALARTKYRNGVLAYLKQYPADDSNYFMLEALTHTELEAYAMRQMNVQMPLFLRESLQRPDWVWSKALSRAVFKNLTEDTPNGFHYQEFAKILNLGIHFDLVMIDDLYKKSQQEQRDWNQQVLRSQLVMPLLRILELKREIEMITHPRHLPPKERGA